MENRIDNEATQFPAQGNEYTKCDNPTGMDDRRGTVPPVPPSRVRNPEVCSATGSYRIAAVGAAAGMAMGAGATAMFHNSDNDNDDESNVKEIDKPQLESVTHREHLTHPELVDDQVNVATTVNDDMAFGEAFSAARAEVGPGGVFEWHGQIYGTYTAGEWNGMTADERAAFNGHFAWNRGSHAAKEEVRPAGNAPREAVADDGPVKESDVEVIGVVHDDVADANFGLVEVDGLQVVLVDIDNDEVFDAMVADVNGNGVIEDEEIVDISDQWLTVNDLGGFTDPNTDLTAAAEPDFMDDDPGCEV